MARKPKATAKRRSVTTATTAAKPKPPYKSIATRRAEIEKATALKLNRGRVANAKPVKPVVQWGVKLDDGCYLMTVRAGYSIVSLFPSRDAAARAAHRAKGAGANAQKVTVSDA